MAGDGGTVLVFMVDGVAEHTLAFERITDTLASDTDTQTLVSETDRHIFVSVCGEQLGPIWSPDSLTEPLQLILTVLKLLCVL